NVRERSRGRRRWMRLRGGPCSRRLRVDCCASPSLRSDGGLVRWRIGGLVGFPPALLALKNPINPPIRHLTNPPSEREGDAQQSTHRQPPSSPSLIHAAPPQSPTPMPTGNCDLQVPPSHQRLLR